VRLNWLPDATADLFERAFAKGGRPRPSGAEWAAALGGFEQDLVTCAASPMHRYARSRGGCPWCDLERAGLFLFVTGGSAVPGAVFLDLDAVQRHIDEIPALATLPLPVNPDEVAVAGEPLPRGRRLQRRGWLFGSAASLATLVVLTTLYGQTNSPVDVGWMIVAALVLDARPRLGALKRARRSALRSAEAAFGEAVGAWHAVADMHELEARRYELRQKLEAYRGLPAKFTAERAQLEADKPRHQMRAYLDRFLIADVKLPGVGRKRRATLLSFGIETALDVQERLSATYIPKFGDTTRSVLFAWLRYLELRFRYDPTQPLDPRLVNDLLARENRERSDLERDLRGGPQALTKLAVERVARREALRPELVRLAVELAQARSDVRVLGRL
jgi:DNA-binding helix-hairpin-helix protein with protein kinase domain